MTLTWSKCNNMKNKRDFQGQKPHGSKEIDVSIDALSYFKTLVLKWTEIISVSLTDPEKGYGYYLF